MCEIPVYLPSKHLKNHWWFYTWKSGSNASFETYIVLSLYTRHSPTNSPLGKIAGKWWDRVGSGQILASRFSWRGQHARWHNEALYFLNGLMSEIYNSRCYMIEWFIGLNVKTLVLLRLACQEMNGNNKFYINFEAKRVVSYKSRFCPSRNSKPWSQLMWFSKIFTPTMESFFIVMCKRLREGEAPIVWRQDLFHQS